MNLVTQQRMILEAMEKYPKGCIILSRRSESKSVSSGNFEFSNYTNALPMMLFDSETNIIVWSQDFQTWAKIENS